MSALCDRSCPLFQARRQECQLDKCAAIGVKCITDYNAPNTTTDCLTWCCQPDNNMLVVLIIICIVVFLAIVACILFAFFYCCRKKDKKGGSGGAGGLTEDAIQERQLELAEEARLEKEKRAREALEASKPQIGVKPKPKDNWLAAESDGGYTTDRSTARAAAYQPTPSSASTAQPPPATPKQQSAPPKSSSSSAPAAAVAPQPSAPSTGRGGASYRGPPVDNQAPPAIAVSRHDSLRSSTVQSSQPADNSVNLPAFPPRSSVASTVTPGAALGYSQSYLPPQEDTPQRDKPADESFKFFASPMQHEASGSGLVASKNTTDWRQQAAAASSAPAAAPVARTDAGNNDSQRDGGASLNQSGGAGRPPRGSIRDYIGTEDYDDNDYGYNPKKKAQPTKYVPTDEEVESAGIANQWAKPKQEEYYPMPGDRDSSNAPVSSAYAAAASAPAPVSTASPAVGGQHQQQPIRNDMFGDLDFGVDVHGGDEFDDGFDF